MIIFALPKMETKIEYQDLVYFGYDYEQGSEKAQVDFMREIKEKFPNVEFKDAYDNIKGYRQEIYLKKENSDNYYSWLIGAGWFELSLFFQLLMMSAGKEPEQKAKFDKYFNLAKEQYPQNFKSKT
jgi:hypothetical protein